MEGSWMSQKLKSFDLYRKIPKDLTEASLAGGTVSVLAATVMVVLFIMEMVAFARVAPVTNIVVDTSEDGEFRINFNLTFPMVSCEFASVDLVDVIGHRRVNITDTTVHKYALDGTKIGSALKDHKEVHYGDTDVDHYGNKKYSVELTDKNWAPTIKEHKVVLVNFHAPWCPHCQMLAPVWEHAAEKVHEAGPGIKLTSVDCTVRENVRLCRANHIQAFPSIRVFREGTDMGHIGQRGTGKISQIHLNPLQELHESYYGVRTADAISKFALSVLKEIEALHPQQRALPAVGSGSDTTGDGVHDSKVLANGCNLEGYITTSRVPGSLVVTPHSTGHSFNVDTVNMTHIIHHLSFGPKLTPRDKATLVKGLGESMVGGPFAKVAVSLGWFRGAKDGEGGSSFFKSNEEHQTHEHYVKVVPHSYQPVRGKAIETYSYTASSYKYTTPKDVEASYAKFTYDIAPMQVLVTETRRPLIDGLTSMCAIIGGVYTCSQILEGLVQKSISTYKKMKEGKLG